MRGAIALTLLLLSGTAHAVTPPAPPLPAPAKVESEEHLFTQLKQCGSAEDAHPIEAKLQAMFRASGSASVDLLMTRAQTAQGAGDAKTARQLVEAVTNIAPKYAEGW